MGNLCAPVSQQGFGYAHPHTARLAPVQFISVGGDNALSMAKALKRVVHSPKSVYSCELPYAYPSAPICHPASLHMPPRGNSLEGCHHQPNKCPQICLPRCGTHGRDSDRKNRKPQKMTCIFLRLTLINMIFRPYQPRSRGIISSACLSCSNIWCLFPSVFG